MDPSDPHRLLVGTRRVYETTNDADSWTAISPELSPGQYITALAIAPSAPGTIYAATADGRVFVTRDGGANWQEQDLGLPREAFDHIVDIEVDPLDPNHAFIVPGTFPTNVFGSSHVWATTNGGGNWTDISGNLPPTYWTNSLAVDWRFATPVLYAGTARGVFASADLGVSWSTFAPGLPNATVTDLQFLPQFDLLAAASYGRGVFEVLVPEPDAPGPARLPPDTVAASLSGTLPPERALPRTTDPAAADRLRAVRTGWSLEATAALPAPAGATAGTGLAAAVDRLFAAWAGAKHRLTPSGLRLAARMTASDWWLEDVPSWQLETGTGDGLWEAPGDRRGERSAHSPAGPARGSAAAR
jgi:hypothetical protein